MRDFVIIFISSTLIAANLIVAIRALHTNRLLAGFNMTATIFLTLMTLHYILKAVLVWGVK